jgi:hypothetical protein
MDEASLTGSAVIYISVSHLKTWQDSGDVSTAKSAFLQAVLKYMIVSLNVKESLRLIAIVRQFPRRFPSQELGIEYIEPAKPWMEQPVSSFPSLGSAGNSIPTEQ